MAKLVKQTPRAEAEAAFKPKRTEHGMRDGVGLEAGRMGRRLRGWMPTRVHVNTLISQSGLTTLARSRFLYRNNAYAKSAAVCFKSNTIGDGIRLSWKSPLEEENAAEVQKKDTHTLFSRWADEADADGVGSFYGLQERVAVELFIAGECFVRRRPRYLSDGLPVPMQLQLLPSEMLPTFLTMPLDNGNVIRQGIEFDKLGRRVAYHFWRTHPGDQTVIPKYGERIRITADQILHIYDPEEAGQIRGLPKLTPIIVLLWMLDLYDDAELDRKKTAALFSVFIKRPDPDGEFFEKSLKEGQVEGPSEGDWQERGGSEVQLSPGIAHTLFPGEDVEIGQPADSGHSYEPFQYRALTKACAGLGLPYAGVTWDLVKANYSNMRGAMIEARRRIKSIQKNIMVFQFCRPVMRWFLDAAHIAGALDFDDYAENPAPYLNADWIAPPWMWLDPMKDTEGEVLQVNAGFKARSQVIEDRGDDPVEIDNRIAADKKRADSLGLVFSGTASTRSQLAEAPTESSDQAEAQSNSGQPPQEESSPASPPGKSPAPKAKPKQKPANASVN